MKNIKIKLYQANFMWFEIYDAFHPEVLNYDQESAVDYATIGSNFDYEKILPDKWRVHIDIIIKVVPAGAIYVRSSFEFKCKGISWDQVFVDTFLSPMVRIAMDKSIAGLKENFEEVGIAMPYEINIDDANINGITANMNEQYLTYRKPQDIANSELINVTGIEFTPGNKSIIPLNGTFAIMDELLFNNNSFSRKHNCEVFEDFVPLPMYFTLKMNCLEIDHQSVKLSFLNTVLFFHCLDCALQILLTDKSDLLLPNLESQGFNQEVNNLYLKYGGELFKQLKESLVNSNVRVKNMEEYHDWDQLIK